MKQLRKKLVANEELMALIPEPSVGKPEKKKKKKKAAAAAAKTDAEKAPEPAEEAEAAAPAAAEAAAAPAAAAGGRQAELEAMKPFELKKLLRSLGKPATVSKKDKLVEAILEAEGVSGDGDAPAAAEEAAAPTPAELPKPEPVAAAAVPAKAEANPTSGKFSGDSTPGGSRRRANTLDPNSELAKQEEEAARDSFDWDAREAELMGMKVRGPCFSCCSSSSSCCCCCCCCC